MIPIIRSHAELMAITQSGDYSKKENNEEVMDISSIDSGQRKRYLRSREKSKIELPNSPRTARRIWKRKKEAVYKFLYGLHYNNQIQSSYEITLLERQRNYDQNDVA